MTTTTLTRGWTPAWTAAGRTVERGVTELPLILALFLEVSLGEVPDETDEREYADARQQGQDELLG